MTEIMRPWPRSIEGGLLEYARTVGVLSALDQHFATRLSNLYGVGELNIRWALAIACRQEFAGHVCADLFRLSEDGLLAESVGREGSVFPLLASNESVEEWIEEISQAELVEVISSSARDASQPRPLVLDSRGRLYLRRAYQSQESLAERIRERVCGPDLEVDWKVAQAGMARLMPDSESPDSAPELALKTALARPLTIVTGGPGTGKTTMVARLIALLIEQAIETAQSPPSVRLFAPTGKAAAAMASSFAFQREALDLSDDVRAAMNVSGETIHRALLSQTARDGFGKPRSLQLEDDIVVIDEASMVDLELMARIFEACRSVGRIVMLGDPDQLASVDAGAVLSELCVNPNEERNSAVKGLSDSVVRLQTSHRFDALGGIGRLADAIRKGDGDLAIALLADPQLPEIERIEIASVSDSRARLIESSRQVHREIEEAASLDGKLEAMLVYRILCAHRGGPLGVESLCAVLDEAAARERGTSRRSGWWPGRMILVTQNAPDQDLWNGDVGLVEEVQEGLRALFADGTGGLREFSVGRLPVHESAIAMSVHKSQGSEFDVVDLVLGDVLSRVMTRELVYTGVTRARTQLRIHASEEVLRNAISRRVKRDSGLSEIIWAG